METDREFSNVVDIAQFPGRSIVTRRRASADPDTATGETVDGMSRGILNDCASVPVWLATQDALSAPGALVSKATRATAIHNLIARRVKFRHDEPVLENLLGLDKELDLLLYPARLLTMRRPMGDCDDFTMLACAMLLSAGVPCEIVTIKADPGDPDRYSHVYCQAIVEDGPLVMDCSQAAQHGYPAGWEAPHYFDKRTWGVMYPPEKGLHGYGLGDEICDIFGCYPGADSSAPAPVSSGGGSGINWNSLIGTIVQGGIQIGKQVTLPAGAYVQTKEGVMSNQVPGAIPGQYPSTVGVNLGGVSGTTLIIGGVIGLGLILALSGKR